MRLTGKFFLLSFLAFLAASAAVGAPLHLVRNHSKRVAIDKLEDHWRDAMLKGDAAAVDSMLSSGDYMAITPEGVILTREQTLASIRNGSFSFTAFDVLDRKIRFFANTAVVTSHADVKGVTPSGKLEGVLRFTHVFIRDQAGKWKIVHFEANRFDEPKGRDRTNFPPIAAPEEK
jgi:ketosteroid isomerase-like protein